MTAETEIFLPNLLTEITRIGARALGEVGIAALHLESGRSLLLNDEQRFPPGSCVKVPIALAVLDRVDRGELALDDMIEVRAAEMNPMAPGGLGEQFVRPGIALSVFNHLEGMITRSCNTSTDVLFRVVGGPPAVGAWLARTGIRDFDVSRTMRYALAVMHDVALPPDDVSMADALRNAPAEVLDARNSTTARFQHEKRDHARPSAMLDVLRRIFQADGVSADGRKTMLDIMARTITSDERIRARLQPGLPFASKTGSGAGTAVDVGFLTLPQGRGTLALAIFIKASRADMATRNEVIADIARLIADYYIITSNPT